jgi:hypothetical protein
VRTASINSAMTNDEGSTHLWNVGLFKRDYTALYPEDCHLHIRRLENLKSHEVMYVQVQWKDGNFFISWSINIFWKSLCSFNYLIN